MIKVYNSDRKNAKNSNVIMRHFGISPVAAADRIESMFAHQATYAINHDFSVYAYNITGQIIKNYTLMEHLKEFCIHANKFSISEYLLTVNKPLRLVDLWEDDPIGSAGPQVVESSQLTPLKLKEIQSLFSPFTEVIHPQHIFNVFSIKKIKEIKRHYAHNRQFIDEFKKRKQRSNSIGEDFNLAQYQEIVWLDLTFKLKVWALQNGFDSFVYSDFKEGNGEDVFVALKMEQVSCTGKYLQFNEEKYLAEMPDIIKKIIVKLKNKPLQKTTHVLWGQQDPMCYWE